MSHFELGEYGQLVSVIEAALPAFGNPRARIAAAFAADAAMTAGWRPPAQVITDPAELDALPDEAVIRTRYGSVAVKADEAWEFPNQVGRCLSEAIDLPVTVLWSPTEKTEPTA